VTRKREAAWGGVYEKHCWGKGRSIHNVGEKTLKSRSRVPMVGKKVVFEFVTKKTQEFLGKECGSLQAQPDGRGVNKGNK